MSALRQHLEDRGFAANAIALANPALITPVLADAPVFEALAADLAREDIRGVPYRVTDAIVAIAHDAALAQAVEEILQTRSWVMWGSNIRKSVPNQAQQWHADIESVLWPTLTVAVGLRDCGEDSATWFIPGSHSIGKGPARVVENCASTADVAAKAHTIAPHCGNPQRVNGFRTGRFYLFNARSWHRADPAGSTDKLVLYLHFQPARDKRIPHMLDYSRHRWSRAACPFVACAMCDDLNTQVYRPPLRHLFTERVQTLFFARE